MELGFPLMARKQSRGMIEAPIQWFETFRTRDIQYDACQRGGLAVCLSSFSVA